MHQTKKGQQWHFGMKAHIGVDADSGLVHTVIGTAANVNDVTQAAGGCQCLPPPANTGWISHPGIRCSGPGGLGVGLQPRQQGPAQKAAMSFLNFTKDPLTKRQVVTGSNCLRQAAGGV